jgi:hypothetical protein
MCLFATVCSTGPLCQRALQTSKGNFLANFKVQEEKVLLSLNYPLRLEMEF